MANSAVSDFVDDLVSEIESGIYDRHLRGIARACYKRRGQLQDGVGIVEDPLIPTIDEEDAPASPINNGILTAYEVFQNGTKAEAIPVKKGQRVRNNAFRWNGVRYWRGYIDGNYYYFDDDVRPAKFRKMCVRIEEVFIEGTSRSRLKIIACDTDPQQVGRDIEISRNLLMKRLLGIN